MKYITTNIRLEEDLYRKLKHLAVERGQRAAELIREALREFLGEPSPEKEFRIEDDPFWKVIGTVDTGITDGSINHDHYIYGWPKKEPE